MAIVLATLSATPSSENSHAFILYVLFCRSPFDRTSKKKYRNMKSPASSRSFAYAGTLIGVLLCHVNVGDSFLAPRPPSLPIHQVFERGDEEAALAGDGKISFEALGLSDEALRAVKAQRGWDHPTPIQNLAIRRLLSSSKKPPDSIWCEAPTGSGKTAAYALPLLQLLSRQKADSKSQFSSRIASLVLCPTRELAVQIASVIQKLSLHMSCKDEQGKRRGFRIQVIHGGVQLEPQIASLAKCIDEEKTIDVLVATPGRLVDVLTHYRSMEEAETDALERRILDALDDSGRTDSSLSLAQIQDLELDRIDDDGRSNLADLLVGIQYLVLDEADRILGRPFETELDAVLDLLPPRKKITTWLFSATFPKQIEPRADVVLKRLAGSVDRIEPPVRLSCGQSDRKNDRDERVSGRLEKRLKRTTKSSYVQVDGPASSIQFRTIRLEERHRTQALRRLLESKGGNRWDRVLVFVATRYASHHVARKLRRVGIAATELHGKLNQDDRIRRLKDFERGKVRVLLATDVASRGLDIIGLPAVVNYDLPRSTVDFVHRVGRTGRAGRPGTAVTFVTPTSEAQLDLIESRHLQNPVERELLPGFEPDEYAWSVQSEASRASVPGTFHSNRGLAHDRMYGGIKGRRKSKKDRLREKAAAARQGSKE